jgi:hypothetical protein
MGKRSNNLASSHNRTEQLKVFQSFLPAQKKVQLFYPLKVIPPPYEETFLTEEGKVVKMCIRKKILEKQNLKFDFFN